MLQSDPAAGLQKLLVVLVVVVPLVLVADEEIRDLGVAAARRLHRLHVIETSEPAGDVA